MTYGDWVELVSAFVDAEAAKEPSKPIVLYGLSAGGMLAYQVAAKNKHVKGIVGMTFLDQLVQEVRKGSVVCQGCVVPAAARTSTHYVPLLSHHMPVHIPSHPSLVGARHDRPRHCRFPTGRALCHRGPQHALGRHEAADETDEQGALVM